MNIFITGTPGAGKSSLISELIEYAKQQGMHYCGILTPEIRKNNIRVGFKIIALPKMREEILASVDYAKPKVSKYGVNVLAIERIIDIVEEDFKDAELVFIDEIGKMEMLSERFKEFLSKALGSDKKVIATLNLALLKEYKNYGRLLWLSKQNYSEVKKKLFAFLANDCAEN